MKANLHLRVLLPLACLLAAEALVFAPAPILGPDRVLFGFDTVEEHYAWQSWVWGEWRAGRPPVWNSHLACGFPFLANSNASPLYPPNAIHLFLPTATALDLSILIHLLGTGAGMLAFLGLLGCSPPAAVAGSLTWMLNGFMIGNVFHGSFAQLFTLAWTPWLFWSVERACRAGTIRAFLPAAGFLGIALLAGHPQYAMHLLAGSAVWAIARAPAGSRGRAAAGWGVAAGAGALIAAVQLVPLGEFFFHSSRRGGIEMPYRWLSSLPLWQLPNLLAPGFFGDEISTPYWGHFLHGLVTPYVGLLALMAAPAARRAAPRSVFWALVALGLGGLLLSMPAEFPPARWLHSIPPLSFFRLPSRWLHLFAFAASALSGLGVQAWIGMAGASRRSRMAPLCGPLVWVAAAGLGLVLLAQGETGGLWRSIYETAAAASGALISPDRRAEKAFLLGAFRASVGSAFTALALATLALAALRTAGRLAVKIPLAGWLPAATVALDLCLWSQRYAVPVPVPSPLAGLPARAEDPFRIASLLPLQVDRFPGRLAETWRGFTTYDQGVYHLLALANLETPQASFNSLLRDYLDLATGGPPFEQAFLQDRGAMDILNVRYVVAPPGATNPAESWTWNLPDEATDLTKGLVRVKRGPGYVLYENPGARPRAAGAQSIRWIERGDGRMRMRAHFGSEGLLVVSECFYPGWRGTVDGRPEKVVRAAAAFIGIPVPAGDHEIELRYVPTSFRVALAVSILAALGTLAASLLTRGAKTR